MITEEKLQKFLDDLRIGKYDSLNYIIKYYYGGLIFEDINKNVKFKLTPYKKRKIIKHNWEFFISITPTPPEDKSIDIFNEVKISEKLFRSWEMFIGEQREKEELVFKSNLESAFDL